MGCKLISTKKQLLALPVRKWSEPSEYASLLIVPSGKKHGSGWHLMAVVGCRNQIPIEIAAYCDDISWEIKTKRAFRTDMPHVARISQVWGNEIIFVVGCALSSTNIVITDEVK